MHLVGTRPDPGQGMGYRCDKGQVEMEGVERNVEYLISVITVQFYGEF